MKQSTEEYQRKAVWISAALLRWFRKAARPMAWRETRDPYRIWVSEIMLQQTRVETVAPYYERFLLEFPDVASLARAPLDAVLKAWEGLGYYSRARNLHRTAGILVARHGAAVPCTVEALEALPGIGRSTAGAIAAIAFGADVPILDANARRVVARLFAVEGDPRSSGVENLLWERSANLVRKGKGRETALAVMDLGATVCLPKAPRCRECPLESRCSSRLRGLQDSIPPRRAGKTLPHHDVVAAVFRRADGALFLMRRPSDGLLGGLWAFPSGRRGPGETLEEALRRIAAGETSDARGDSKEGGSRASCVFPLPDRFSLLSLRGAGGRVAGGRGDGLAPPGRGRDVRPSARRPEDRRSHPSGGGTMKLRELLKPGGRGVIGTASKAGVVNMAVYAVPQIVDDETVAWGMTDGRTWNNVRENPNASYTYFAPGEGFRGARLALTLSRTEDSGGMLAKIRERTGESSPGDPEAVKHVAYFKVVETRPLV